MKATLTFEGELAEIQKAFNAVENSQFRIDSPWAKTVRARFVQGEIVILKEGEEGYENAEFLIELHRRPIYLSPL